MEEQSKTMQVVPGEQEINLRDLIRIFLKRKHIVVSFLVITFLVTVIKTYTTVPYYSASADVLIERNRGSQELGNYYYYYEPEFLETQTEIIRSINVARRVVEELQLDSKYRRYFFQPSQEQPSFFASIKQNVLGWANNLFRWFAGLFSSETETGAETGGGGIMQDEPLTDQDIIAMRISGGLSVTPIKNTKVVSIVFTGRDPGMAALIVNAVVKAYIDETLEIKLANSSYALRWMTDKAQEERARMEASEQELQRYMRDNDLVTVEDKLTIFPQKLNEFSSQLSRAQSERKELGTLVARIEAAGADPNALGAVPVFADSQVLKNVREKIYKANQTIKELSKKYGPKHPVMIKARDELEILESERNFEVQRIVSATRNAYDLAVSKESDLKELLEETKNEILNLNEKYIQYSIIKRDVDSNRILYDALESRIKKESATEQSQNISIWVVKEAQVPGAPSRPNKRRNLLLGLALGLCGGIGLAFLVEYLDNTIKSQIEMEERYKLPVLGTIEMFKENKSSIESHIIEHPLSPLAENYRLIRTGLMLSAAEHPPRSILVTSMGAGDGKTTTSLNLARVLTQEGKSVLIIDCDLRKPRMHSLLEMENKIGLSNYLTGNCDEAVIQDVPGEQIKLISSGPKPPNPAELLHSGKMEEILRQMTARFDFIILDCSPVQSVTDSLALSHLVEGTLIVIRFGKTTYDMVESGLKKFANVQANLLGFVLNGIKASDVRGYYYYGYESYYDKESKG
jgi:capsular exopolysaccharide synthesis family protein